MSLALERAFYEIAPKNMCDTSSLARLFHIISNVTFDLIDFLGSKLPTIKLKCVRIKNDEVFCV